MAQGYRTPERINEDGEAEKQCGKCGEWWPLTAEFWHGQDGVLQSPCKACQAESKRALINEPCCVEGCDKPRYVNKAGRVASRCREHFREQNKKNERKRGAVMALQKMTLTEAQKQTLVQVAIRSRGSLREWVDAGDCNLNSLRALADRQLIVLNVTVGKRLVRVTAAGWREIGEPKPDFHGDDLKPMEATATREGRYDPAKARVVVESKQRGESPSVTVPDMAKFKLSASPQEIKKVIDEVLSDPMELLAEENGSGERKCEEGCAYREVIEMLARKDPRVAALVDTLERERALLEELGLERAE